MAPRLSPHVAEADPGSVLVLGATGVQGGAIARGLLEGGRSVHALVRTPGSARAARLADAGARIVVGDLLDGSSLVRAFSEVACVYAVTTPFAEGPEAEVRQGDTIVAAAQEAGLPWLILASVASADRATVPHFQSKARIERRLAASQVPWTVVAPSYFYENVLGASGRFESDRLAIAVPFNTPLAQIALRDLAAVVAAILTRRDEHLYQRVEVAGDAPTPGEMAASLGVPFEHLALREVRGRNPDLAAMYEFLSDRGYGIDVYAVRARFPEVAWKSFAQWARDLRGDDR